MGLALEQWALKVVATQRGFYGDRMHYEAGSKQNPARGGIPFVIRADALKYDREGKMHVTKDLKPILPSWVQPQEEVKPIEKDWLHVIVDAARPKLKNRKRPAAVKAVAPLAWPKNQKRRLETDQAARPLKIKSGGTGMFGTAHEDDDNDENEG